MAKIRVLVDEGQVKAVEGIPVGMSVEVRNYDVDPLDNGGLWKDQNG